MLSSQIHLAFNHFPVAAVFFGSLFFLLAIVCKNQSFKTSAAIILIVSGILTIPLYLSGEHVEKTVSRKPMISRYTIHEHEESADRAMVLMMFTTFSSIGFLILNKKQHRLAEKAFYLTFALNIFCLYFISDAAHKGGQIRHDQLRVGQSSSNYME